MKNISVITIAILQVILLMSCQKVPPQVITDETDESGINESSAVIMGHVTDEGSEQVIECGFFWGEDQTNMQKLAVEVPFVFFGTTLKGLSAEKKYYYKAYAESPDGTGEGEIKEFTTIGIPSTGEMIANYDIEHPGVYPNWWYDGLPNFIFQVTSEEYVSPSHSLKISVPAKSNTVALWGFLRNEDLPLNKKLTLTARIKCVNLAGVGASIVIRCDDINHKTLQFVTSEATEVINGTTDWTEYSVVVNQVPFETANILVYLIVLPNSTGTIYFDDIHLIAE